MTEFVIDQDRLPVWAVYDHPTDYPDHWVARLWYSLPMPEVTNQLIIADTQEQVREQIVQRSPEMLKLPRLPVDDPKIVETWM